jgi:glucokinase
VAKHPEALAAMARFYGQAVCHYMVNTLALGGIFITGGLAANLPGLLEHPEFAAELRERNPMRHILAPVPVRHVKNQDVGLWGAAACASMMLL